MPKQIPDHQIFAAVLDLIGERGFAGATTKEIAAAAGVHEVTLFRRYGSKVALVEAALEGLVAGFEAAGGARYSGDLRADLLRVVELYRDLVTRRGRLIAVMLGELPRTAELRPLIERPQRIVRAVARLVARYQREGALRREPPLQAVASLLGPLLVAGMLATHDLLRPELPEAVDHVERFLDGRRAPPLRLA